MGEVSAYFEDGQLERWLEFGLALYDQRLWNGGLGTAACQLWLTYLFELHPELPRVGFTTWSGNFAMMRLGEKLGMEKEAQIRKVRFWQGQYYDSIKYGVLREMGQQKKTDRHCSAGRLLVHFPYTVSQNDNLQACSSADASLLEVFAC